jgi:hypothetical protein
MSDTRRRLRQRGIDTTTGQDQRLSNIVPISGSVSIVQHGLQERAPAVLDGHTLQLSGVKRSQSIARAQSIDTVFAYIETGITIE